MNQYWWPPPPIVRPRSQIHQCPYSSHHLHHQNHKLPWSPLSTVQIPHTNLLITTHAGKDLGLREDKNGQAHSVTTPNLEDKVALHGNTMYLLILHLIDLEFHEAIHCVH
ncbi:hypothetical protein Lalb_Chr07g0190151 [Lupinus albus]|uniref:Uncharacterized protein n=1 Tax=Lupinus albus TaxID=3870 RepID=A0A6A4QAA6_LUPAL|nr:hypothetical protein Lalb_Chr07g0190151 [Lupinus albus]